MSVRLDSVASPSQWLSNLLEVLIDMSSKPCAVKDLLPTGLPRSLMLVQAM